MTRSSTPPILVELQNPSSYATQIAALKALKNEVVGHDQKKEAWIGYGILPLLSRILFSRRGGNGKRISRDVNGDNKLSEKRQLRTEEDDACLQAVIIVGSLAYGGSAFVTPILASNVLSSLLFVLSSTECAHTLTLAILKTLNTIADRLPLERPYDWPQDKQLANLLYSPDHIGTLGRILSQSSSYSHVQLSITLTASLISKTCAEEVHKAALAEAGVLDALATRLASFVVSQGFVLPCAESYVHDTGHSLPPSAPPNARLAPVLQAVAVIVEQSKARANHVLTSPAIANVFPKMPYEFSPTDFRKAPWGASYFSGSAVPRPPSANPIDSLLPSVPTPPPKTSSQATNFPPLGSQATFGKTGSFLTSPLSVVDSTSNAISAEEDENALISWLIYLIRAESGTTRLMAARLVIIYFRLGLVRKQRIPVFSYLLVPLLVRMLDKEHVHSLNLEAATDGGTLPPKLTVKEEAPAILASLIMDSAELQKAAVDANAIKKLCQLLKESYDPIPDGAKAMWVADGRKTSPVRHKKDPDCCLGRLGLSTLARHMMRFREGVLKALAAIAAFKDEYRKAICDNAAVPYIIDSLKPYQMDTQRADQGSVEQSAPSGNPTPTLLAACGAARALTRSVSALRTSLIDAGVATPLFGLLKYRDVEVQIAATSVICNLAMDFSPMKEAVIGAGVLKILCEHALSCNKKLCLDSMWALKHLVYNASNDIRMKIFEMLGPAWIKSVLSMDTTETSKKQVDEETGGTSSIAMGSANAVGEQIDLLNPRTDDGSEDMRMTDSLGSLKNGSDSARPSSDRRRQLVLNGDLDTSKQARLDDIAVQEQTLDFIRNLVCAPGAPDMVDYLFEKLGREELLRLLTERLRPRSYLTSNRKDTEKLPIPAEIIVSVTYVIIHLAASVPRHRQYLASQKELLRAIVPLFKHTNRTVRVNCAWTVINLTYEDDPNDHTGCRQRAHELKNLGFLEKLGTLSDDPDLDVRERTKTALSLMGSLLREQQ